MVSLRLFEVWSGMSVWSPVLLGQVLFGSVGHGFSWRGTVLRGRAQHGEVLYGRVKRSSVRLGKVFHGLARSCCAVWGSVEWCFVWQGKVLLWPGDVLFGVAGFIGVLYSKVRSYCGVVWNREALYRMVKFCPVKHGTAGLGIMWSGDVRYSEVLYRGVMQAKAFLGGVESC